MTSSGVKFRLINLASNNQTLQLSMAVNSISVASNIAFAKASAYTEVTGVPQNTASLLEVSNGPTVLATKSLVYQVGNIFTAITVSVPDATTSTGVQNFVLSSSGTS